MATTSQLRELAEELRRLKLTSPVNKDELTAWYLESRSFANRLDSQYADVDLPEEVWHYLHDADLRAKDPQHKQAQDEMLAEIIADLERGVVPKTRGSNIALHPRWLGVAGLVLIALVLYWVAW